MKKVLFIDACVARETSRTERLAQAYLQKLKATEEVEVEELYLPEAGITGLTEETVAFRTACTASGDFSHAMFDPARQFKEADAVVMAAPYWDLSFPATVKEYVEQLCVNGLTFYYSEEGIPTSYCKAKKLTYLTTAGGYLGEYNMGFDYVEAVFRLYFGIPEAECIAAEGLDIIGNDVEAIMAEAIAAL